MNCRGYQHLSTAARQQPAQLASAPAVAPGPSSPSRSQSLQPLPSAAFAAAPVIAAAAPAPAASPLGSLVQPGVSSPGRTSPTLAGMVQHSSLPPPRGAPAASSPLSAGAAATIARSSSAGIGVLASGTAISLLSLKQQAQQQPPSPQQAQQAANTACIDPGSPLARSGSLGDGAAAASLATSAAADEASVLAPAHRGSSGGFGLLARCSFGGSACSSAAAAGAAAVVDPVVFSQLAAVRAAQGAVYR